MVSIKLDHYAAELVGVLLGDGSFYITNSNHEMDIALNSRDINQINYTTELLEKVVKTRVTKKYSKDANYVHLRLSKKDPVNALLSISLIKQGNKIKNKVAIPDWIWTKSIFIKNCLRGLIDTDGSIYRLKPQWPNLFQLSFKNNNKVLLNDVRKAFLQLYFHPSRVFGNRIVLTRQKEIKKFFDDIGTNNDRNLNQYNDFLRIQGTRLKHSPLV